MLRPSRLKYFAFGLTECCLAGVRAVIALIVLTLSTTAARAHEYWLDPVQQNWQTGELFQADIRNGENYNGTAYPFNADSFSIGGLISNNARRPLTGRLGDYPAIQLKLDEPGLHLVLLETQAKKLEYDTVEAFESFIDYHGLTNVVTQYQHKTKSQKFVTERYYRFVKTLFTVSDRLLNNTPSPWIRLLEEYSDSPALKTQGQRYELSVIDSETSSQSISVLLSSDGQPLRDRQVELFFKDATTQAVDRSVKRTDDKGIVSFPASDAGDYLFNSVWIAPDEQTDTDWTTYWASLTLSVNSEAP